MKVFSAHKRKRSTCPNSELHCRSRPEWVLRRILTLSEGTRSVKVPNNTLTYSRENSRIWIFTFCCLISLTCFQIHFISPGQISKGFVYPQGFLQFNTIFTLVHGSWGRVSAFQWHELHKCWIRTTVLWSAVIVNYSGLFLSTPHCEQGLIAGTFCLDCFPASSDFLKCNFSCCRSKSLMCQSSSFKISFQHESHSVFLTCSLALSKGVILDMEYLDRKKWGGTAFQSALTCV